MAGINSFIHSYVVSVILFMVTSQAGIICRYHYHYNCDFDFKVYKTPKFIQPRNLNANNCPLNSLSVFLLYFLLYKT